MATRQIFNATTQQVEDAELSIDHNGEVVATFADGSFLKFPAGITAQDFEAQVKAHEDANKGQVSIEASEKLLDELVGTEPQPTQEEVPPIQ